MVTIKEALESFRNLGYKPKWNPEQQSITFYYFGNKITFFPKKEYFNGKGIVAGFGLLDLLGQLMANPATTPNTCTEPKWISVDHKIPEKDKEVIALVGERYGGEDEPIYRICFAHIVSDSNGEWNISGVRYWIPCPVMPK